MSDVMVDLETLGNGSDACIIAIGAVAFDASGVSMNTFYRVVDAQSSVDAGLKIDASTVMWWMQQSEAARAAFKRKGEPLGDALLALTNWMQVVGASNEVNVWGNGATFDNVILTNAYKAVRLPRPWPYWADKCYRTLKGEYPDVKMAKSGTAHNALDDARMQALHCIAIKRAAGTWKQHDPLTVA